MTDPTLLRGRIGIVTGADSATGRTIAEALAGSRMWLMLLAEPPVRMHDDAERLGSHHGIRCHAATIDVADPAAVDRVLMHVEQYLGPIDVVVSLVPGVLVDAVLPSMEQRGHGNVIHVPPSMPAPRVLAPSAVGAMSSPVTVAVLPATDDAAAATLAELSGPGR